MRAFERIMHTSRRGLTLDQGVVELFEFRVAPLYGEPHSASKLHMHSEHNMLLQT